MHCIAPKCAPNDTEGYRFKHIELVNSFLDDKTEVSNVVTGATVRICGKVSVSFHANIQFKFYSTV